MRPFYLRGRLARSLPAAASALAVAHRVPKSVLMGVAVGALLSGCSSARPGAQIIDDAVRQTDTLLQNADTLPTGAMRPRPSELSRVEIPPATADDLDTLVEQSAEDLLTPVAQRSNDESEFMDTVKGACTANDIVALADNVSWEEAAYDALVSFGGNATLQERVEELGQEMRDAETSGDEVEAITVFLICEEVG